MNYKKLKTKLHKNIKEKIIYRLLPDGYYLKVSGFCPICEKRVKFYSKSSWLRDNFKCSNCKSIPRHRALMMILNNYYPNWRDLKIHESSPGKSGASLKMKIECKNYIPTQFFQKIALGTEYNGVRCENLEKQTFENESFDIVITQDVFEHIYNPEMAFSEIMRTLKKGGAHIFTVPLINMFKKTEMWAKPDEKGEPIFLKTPEYHGNPIDPKGSPVTMHWGYDIVDLIKNNTGCETTIEFLDNLENGTQAKYNEVLVTIKS